MERFGEAAAGGIAMREQSRRMALCAMMAALGTAVLMMGGLIPLATFCAPALAALALVPVQVEYGRKYALGVYVATAALGLILCADREAALVFACLGHYPAIRDRFNRIRPRALRVAAKLVLFDLCAGIAFALAALVVGFAALFAEYAELGAAGIAAFVVIANVTLLLYDRFLTVGTLLYERKIRPRLKRRA